MKGSSPKAREEKEKLARGTPRGNGGGGRRWRSPLDAAEGVLRALLGLDLKIEGARGGCTPGEVDEGDLIEADVHGGLVDIDEAPLQGIQEAGACLVGTGDALGTRVSGGTSKITAISFAAGGIEPKGIEPWPQGDTACSDPENAANQPPWTQRPFPIQDPRLVPVPSPLEVARDCDLAVHQCFHDPADHLIERPGHVLSEPPLKTLLHLFPADKERQGLSRLHSMCRGVLWGVTGYMPGNSLVHVEGQGDVLIFGEEKDQEVVAGLPLLDWGVQADLGRKNQHSLISKTPVEKERGKGGGGTRGKMKKLVAGNERW